MKSQQSSAGKKLRAAVIGCGRMGAFTSDSIKEFAPECWFPLSHIEALQLHEDIIVTAISDGNYENLKKARLAYGIENAYENPFEMLERHEIDILCIATRTSGRADLILRAYDAGIRALHVEKPICNSTSELRALSEKFADPDFFVTYGAIRRLLPPYRKARELLLAGDIGTLESITIEHGRGMLLWTHPHSIDLCLYFANSRPLNSISAIFDNLQWDGREGILENDPVLISSTIEFGEKLVAHIGQTPGMNTRLLGDSGEIVVKSNGFSIDLKRSDERNPYQFKSTPVSYETDDRNAGTGAAISLLVNCLYGSSLAVSENIEIKQAILDGQQTIFAMVAAGLTENSIKLAKHSFNEMTIKGAFNGFSA